MLGFGNEALLAGEASSEAFELLLLDSPLALWGPPADVAAASAAARFPSSRPEETPSSDPLKLKAPPLPTPTSTSGRLECENEVAVAVNSCGVDGDGGVAAAAGTCCCCAAQAPTAYGFRITNPGLATAAAAAPGFILPLAGSASGEMAAVLPPPAAESSWRKTEPPPKPRARLRLRPRAGPPLDADDDGGTNEGADSS